MYGCILFFISFTPSIVKSFISQHELLLNQTSQITSPFTSVQSFRGPESRFLASTYESIDAMASNFTCPVTVLTSSYVSPAVCDVVPDNKSDLFSEYRFFKRTGKKVMVLFWNAIRHLHRFSIIVWTTPKIPVFIDFSEEFTLNWLFGMFMVSLSITIYCILTSSILILSAVGPDFYHRAEIWSLKIILLIVCGKKPVKKALSGRYFWRKPLLALTWGTFDKELELVQRICLKFELFAPRIPPNLGLYWWLRKKEWVDICKSVHETKSEGK